MPNIPCSIAQTPAKKRKLSSISSSSTVPTNIVSIDVSSPIQSNPSGSMAQTGNQLSNGQTDNSFAPQSISNASENPTKTEPAVLDDEILQSEVYQIYCRHKDPKEAMKEIRQLKSCWRGYLVTKPFPSEENFKKMCETALDRLWKLEPRLGDSKFEKIKKIINQNQEIMESQLSNLDDGVDIKTFFEDCISWIGILLPNGYEFFYIANFEQGPGKSKWYRAESSKQNQVERLARLKVLGIGNETILKLHYNHYAHYDLRKKSKKTEWLDFAKDLIGSNIRLMFGEAGPQKGPKIGMLSDFRTSDRNFLMPRPLWRQFVFF